jgi:hypothetical protein
MIVRVYAPQARRRVADAWLNGTSLAGTRLSEGLLTEEGTGAEERLGLCEDVEQAANPRQRTASPGRSVRRMNRLRRRSTAAIRRPHRFDHS